MNEEFDRHEEFIMSDYETKYDVFAKEMETKFPKMFSEPYGGFCCGEGWWPIIKSLCRRIQHHVDWAQEQKEKYSRGEGCPQVTVQQVKEKFGGLRFYYSGGNATTDGMVRMAESWAAHTCEDCGSPATKQTSGWIKTVCDKHYDEHESQKRNLN